MVNSLHKKLHLNSGDEVKSLNSFTFLMVMSTLCAMGACALSNTSLRIASYISELLLIGYSLGNSHRIKGSGININAVVFVGIVVVLNNLLSPHQPQYSDLIKIAGYFCCFYYGTTLARRYNSLYVNKVLVYSLIFVPVLAVALFDHSVLKNVFFPNPNTFVYTGLVMGLFYALIHYKERYFMLIAWLIVAFYVLICTSLGVVVAIVLAYMILNVKMTHLPYLLLAGVVVVLAVIFIDIPLFIRVRDVINLWMSLSSDDWKNIQDVNYYELNQRITINGERSDVGSSVWRLAHWSSILSEYMKPIWTIPFGLGAGFSISYTGLLPHNDYLMILTEYGLIIFSLFIKFILGIFRKLKVERLLLYFILTVFLYHATENLIYTFPPNALLYFILGWCLIKSKKTMVFKKI